MCKPISFTSVISNLSVILLALSELALMGVFVAAEVPVVCVDTDWSAKQIYLLADRHHFQGCVSCGLVSATERHCYRYGTISGGAHMRGAPTGSADLL